MLTINEDKWKHCLELIDSLINGFHLCRTVLIKTIKQLAGHLNFICQAIPVGLIFLFGLYVMTSGGEHQRLSSQATTMSQQGDKQGHGGIQKFFG